MVNKRFRLFIVFALVFVMLCQSFSPFSVIGSEFDETDEVAAETVETAEETGAEDAEAIQDVQTVEIAEEAKEVEDVEIAESTETVENRASAKSVKGTNVGVSPEDFFDGEGTEEKPYLIQSSDDWDALSAYINDGGTFFSGKYFKLTQDITVTTVLGRRPGSSDSEDYYFSGTFDGAGNKLKLNISNNSFAAPFAIAHNATIKNLIVTGKVNSTANHASGLVAASKGKSIYDASTLTIKNVTISADISCNTHVAGVVGHAHSAVITMENVVFDGSISASSVQGGYIGWGGISSNIIYNATLKDCLFLGTYNSGAAFHPVAFASGQGSVTLVNDFYTLSAGNGGSPTAITGNGTVKLLQASVEKNGNIKYFDSFTDAADSSNWTEGSTLKLMTDVSVGSTVTVPSGEHTLDLNGHNLRATVTGYSVITVGSNATLIIDDTTDKNGKITGGSVGQNYGGGVTVDGGMLTLKGGAISGNANTYNAIGNCGGGIHVRNAGKFFMEGGEISNNSSYVGGGICTDTSATTVSITGGVIINNVVTRFGSAVWAGRNNSAIFKIGGTAEIIGNISKWTGDKDGEGTLNTGSLYLMSGNPIIHGNWKTDSNTSPNTHVNMDNDGSSVQRIELDGALTNDTGIPNITVTPLYRWQELKNGQTFVFTKNWSKYMGTANPADYFKLDDSVSGIKVIRKDGEAALTGSDNYGDLYIFFNANKGDGEMEPQLVSESTATLNQNKFTFEGKTFVGWNTEADGSGIPYDDKASVTLTGDLTLYAQWSIVHNHDSISFKEWNSTDSLPDRAGNWVLTEDVTINTRWDVPSGTVNLCLNGHAITRTNGSGTTGSVIQVGSGSILNLYDCGTETRYYIIDNPSENGAGLGRVVEKSVYDAAGSDARGTFTGGYITGGNITGATDNNHLIGGGVNVDKGSFTMNGGTIIGNKVCINAGGVKVKGAGASFTMNGGAIIGNYNDCYGGAISVGDNKSNYLCTVNINGGTIERNWSGRNGGAIHMDGYKHTFNITGGRIVNNYTNGNYDNGSTGRSGGGIIVSGGIVNLSGNPVIRDNYNGGNVENNVYLNTKADFSNLSVKLSEGADVGIYTKALDKSSDIKTATGDRIDILQYLHFDIPTDGIIVFCDGTSDWVYINGESVEMVGAHHTHEAGSAWICAEANFVAELTVGDNSVIYPKFNDAVSAWNNAADGSTLKLLADVTTTSSVNVIGKKNLDLNGFGIKAGSSGYSVINVNNNTVLNLNDSNPETVHKFTVSNPASNGAGLAVVDDGLTGDYKTFTGGYITGGNTGSGGGVIVQASGSFIMNAGTIIGNQASWMGAGVKSNNSNIGFTMNGGVIMYNKIVGWGSGVCSDGAVKVTGGTISYNYASKNPGGIHCHYLYISGGRIENNYANENEYAAGVHADDVVEISGNPVISANVFNGTPSNLDWDRKDNTHGYLLVIAGELTEGADVHVILTVKDTGVFTTGWKKYMDKANPADYFTADNENYVVKTDSSGEAKIGLPHTHNWEYSADGNVITATCTGEEECDLDTQTVTISAEGKTYDGTAVEATVTKSENWTAYGLTEPGSVVYSGNTDAGTYTASVTVDDATAVTEFTINKKSMADEISSDGYTGDYDGESHKITVSAPEDADIRYGTKNGEYTLDSNPEYVNAGEYKVYYEVTKKNYLTVTGSETVKINAIDVNVTVTGKNTTADYDGKAHSADGFDVVADTDLYDVTKDITFNGNDKVELTDAGTVYMGLASEQFTNNNSNFATVTFSVTDGFVKINTVDAVITTAPAGTDPIYNGSELKLVSSGKADGGTLYYAVNKDPKNLPADSSFDTAVPSAKATGSYYVWYKVKGDANHNDIAPASVRVILAEKNWVKLNGTLYKSDGVTPVSDAKVALMKGNQTIDYVITGKDGTYLFIAPVGVYSIVAEDQQNVQTSMVTLYSDTTQSTVMSGGKTETHLNVDGDNSLGIAVDGLNREADSIRKNDNVPDGKSVSVVMTVESKTKTTASNAKSINSAAKNKSLIFFDTKVEKTVDSTTTIMDKTTNVLEIAVPYSKVNKRGLAVYNSDSTGMRAFRQSTSKEEGTFYVDKEKDIVFIYSNHFSTFAIGYTPYYKVQSSASLGSFDGPVSVTVTSDDGTEVFSIENVEMDKINFNDIPKGQYTMNVTWMDGVENTLSFPLTIGKEETDEPAQVKSVSANAAAMHTAAAAASYKNADTVMLAKNESIITYNAVFSDSFEGQMETDSVNLQNSNDRTFLAAGKTKSGYLRI